MSENTAALQEEGRKLLTAFYATLSALKLYPVENEATQAAITELHSMMAAAVARECLGRWYGDNATAKGEWLLAGRPVEPAEIALPSLCVIPAQDRIVPPASALALAAALPAAERMSPAAGHIGMVVSGQAKATVWQPLLRWIEAQSAGKS